MELESSVFTLPAGTAGRVSQDVSVTRTHPAGISATPPLLAALRALSITDRTIAAAVGLKPQVIGKWRSGAVPVPKHRRQGLRAVLALAVQQAEAALLELDKLPATAEVAMTRAVTRARIEAARLAL
jgi:hypothetical protein